MTLEGAKNLATLSPEEWRIRIATHQARVRPWAEDRRQRGGVAKKHPVYDFLFDYYSFRPSQLLRWSPGVGVLLCSANKQSFSCSDEFIENAQGLHINPALFPEHRIKYLHWALHYLKSVSARPPQLACFGLHEWAMLYKEKLPRHTSVPLRVTSNLISEVCESMAIRCSHYDAYRFFTPQALPLNALKLSRESTPEHDQPACIHVTMDLYRFAYKIAPFSSAELVADAFELAIKAREVDMRASPYDLSSLGFGPIPIETSNGRATYVQIQRKLMEDAQLIRERLVCEYQQLLDLRGD